MNVTLIKQQMFPQTWIRSNPGQNETVNTVLPLEILSSIGLGLI